MACRPEDIGRETGKLHPNMEYAIAHMKPKRRISAPVSVIDLSSRVDCYDEETSKYLDNLTAYEKKRWNWYANRANRPGTPEEERERIHDEASQWHFNFQAFKRKAAGLYSDLTRRAS